MHTGGFEPPKRFASDLKSDPFDQTRVRMLKDDYNDMILFHTELLMVTTQTPSTGFEPVTYRLTAERSTN